MRRSMRPSSRKRSATSRSLALGASPNAASPLRFRLPSPPLNDRRCTRTTSPSQRDRQLAVAQVDALQHVAHRQLAALACCRATPARRSGRRATRLMRRLPPSRQPGGTHTPQAPRSVTCSCSHAFEAASRRTASATGRSCEPPARRPSRRACDRPAPCANCQMPSCAENANCSSVDAERLCAAGLVGDAQVASRSAPARPRRRSVRRHGRRCGRPTSGRRSSRCRAAAAPATAPPRAARARRAARGVALRAPGRRAPAQRRTAGELRAARDSCACARPPWASNTSSPCRPLTSSHGSPLPSRATTRSDASVGLPAATARRLCGARPRVPRAWRGCRCWCVPTRFSLHAGGRAGVSACAVMRCARGVPSTRACRSSTRCAPCCSPFALSVSIQRGVVAGPELPARQALGEPKLAGAHAVGLQRAAATLQLWPPTVELGLQRQCARARPGRGGQRSHQARQRLQRGRRRQGGVELPMVLGGIDGQAALQREPGCPPAAHDARTPSAWPSPRTSTRAVIGKPASTLSARSTWSSAAQRGERRVALPPHLLGQRLGQPQVELPAAIDPVRPARPHRAGSARPPRQRIELIQFAVARQLPDAPAAVALSPRLEGGLRAGLAGGDARLASAPAHRRCRSA